MEAMQSPKKFKFCYIMQGLPGSGKSTVAKELARAHGKIIALDKIIVERKKKLILQDQQKL
jgi:shikimate kinase